MSDYNPDYGKAEQTTTHADSGDYTWPMPVYDTRTLDVRTQTELANLRNAVAILTDEVTHLREDVARMKNGESEL